MCGIAGIVDTGELRDNDIRARLGRALGRLSPRGPDGDGVWSDAHCALGHRRLAIIDLSPGGKQPMERFDRVVTFNGEIFNFAALREELQAMGIYFTTRSDTEVLLAGWHVWGEGFLHRIVGMFAFAIWDPKQRSLTVARDRFGEKPLLFWHQGTKLAFASEFLALEQMAGQRFACDPGALRLYFALRYLPEPLSIAREVHKLPAGHLLRFAGESPQLSHWYDGARSVRRRIDNVSDATTSIRSAMQSAVADRLVSDVPVGAFLSGGIDSAVVAAAMASEVPRARTFTVGFRNMPAYYDERAAAAEVARHLGTDHVEITVEAEDLTQNFEHVFRALDEPFADSSAVASFIVSREARQRVKVALSGDGADEVFGGYRKHQGELYVRRYAMLPAVIRRHLIEPVIARLPESKRHPLLEHFRRLKRFCAVAGKDRVSRHAAWLRALREEELDDLLGPMGQALTVEDLVASAQGEERPDPVSAMLEADIGIVLPSDMLVKVDRMSMANGLEVRCPFLDHRVVEVARALPTDMKLRPGAGKWILRQAFADRLPAQVFRRPKKGFEIPLAEWLTGPLRDFARSATDPARLRRQGMFSDSLPSRWLRDLEAGQRDTSWPLWALISFQTWATLNARPEALDLA